MNRFLKKRPVDAPSIKQNDANSISSPPSPTLKKPSSSKWKKNANNAVKPPEATPQLDLTSVLPSTDDFRTSLIMPSLSTRFSMLREQDDPKSLLGKASDDSVLQPRRRSRMVDFGYGMGGLTDIAEVSSINGSIRPPFAAQDSSRQLSLGGSEEGYSSEAEGQMQNIMGRARPGEGNTMFGGRQKVYKIPVGGSSSTRSLGKLLYEDDVGVSAFQKYRMREREVDESQLPRPSDESQGFDFGLDRPSESTLDSAPNDSAKDLTHSPSLSSYDKKRSTTSSTARSDARSSTAATSIASQPATSAQPSPAQVPGALSTSTNPAASSPTFGAPASGPDRSNSKPRRLYEQGLDQHMQDQQTSAMTRLNSLQRQRAPTGMKSGPFLHGAKSTSNLQDRSLQPVYALGTTSQPPSSLPLLRTVNPPTKSQSNTNSPVHQSNTQSPLEPEDNDIWTRALEPGDRGKATAMGAFNKPAQAFDEDQYLERQKALQRSKSNAPVRSQAQIQTQPISQQEVPKSSEETPRGRSQFLSRNPDTASNFHTAANGLPTLSSRPSARNGKPALPDTHRTFFGNISASEDEEDDDDDDTGAESYLGSGHGPHQPSKWQPTSLQPVSEYPASRTRQSKASSIEEEHAFKPKPLQTANPSRPLRNLIVSKRFDLAPLDSPTLGAPSAQALNGMIHHLRSKSNQSSVYPTDEIVLQDDDAPGLPDVPWDPRKTHYIADDQSNRESYAVSNPWDLDDQASRRQPHASNSSLNLFEEAQDVDIASARALELSLARDGNLNGDNTRNWDDPVVPAASESESSWQRELSRQHTRDASMATQEARDAFSIELAARRNAVQENLKSIVERDSHSRGNSPAPSTTSLRTFGVSRAKVNRESMVHTYDQSSKTSKIMSGGNASNYSLVSQSDTGRGQSEPSPRIPPPTAQHPAFKLDGPGPSRDGDTTQGERSFATGKSAASRRDRSYSRSESIAGGGRSRSRTGPYRDDLEKAMVEGYGSSGAAYTPDTSPLPLPSSDMANFANRASDGKMVANTYFDTRTTRGAPAVQATNTTSTAYNPGRPAPLVNPYSQNTTPPLSDSSPLMSTESYSPIVPSSSRPGGLLRKKTISKHEISEPTLISSTSNVDTVDLPPGASLRNGIEDPPPIPPINPRRRTTRKIFGRARSDSSPFDHDLKTTASDSTLQASPKQEEYQFPPSNVVRIPDHAGRDPAESPAMSQYGFSPSASPERVHAEPHRSATAPMTTSMDGSMF